MFYINTTITSSLFFRGLLKIAEVESRFEDVDNFIKSMQKFGFRNIWKDISHNLFYFLDFTKMHNVRNKSKLPKLTLLPCLYKKRWHFIKNKGFIHLEDNYYKVIQKQDFILFDLNPQNHLIHLQPVPLSFLFFPVTASKIIFSQKSGQLIKLELHYLCSSNQLISYSSWHKLYFFY